MGQRSMPHNLNSNYSNNKPRFESHQKIETDDDDVSDDMCDTDEHLIHSANPGATGGPKNDEQRET